MKGIPMKQMIILAIFTICFTEPALSQSVYLDESKLNSETNSETNFNEISLNKPQQIPANSNQILVGLSIPAGRLSTQLSPGFSVGYNYNFEFTKEVEFFLNLTANVFTTKKTDSASAVERFVDIALLLEYTVGPRVTFAVSPNSPVKLLGEVGVGLYTPIGTKYIFDDSENFSGIESLSDAFRGGINIGVGAYFTGTRTIVTKIKYHKLFSIPTEYFGLYAGITL